MKTPLRPRLFAVALALPAFAVPVFAQSVSRITTVNTLQPSGAAVQAEGEAIARGFEEAYRLMSRETVYLTYLRDDKGFVTLAEIRQVRALNGVVLITTQSGPLIAIPARAVVTITTERPKP